MLSMGMHVDVKKFKLSTFFSASLRPLALLMAMQLVVTPVIALVLSLFTSKPTGTGHILSTRCHAIPRPSSLILNITHAHTRARARARAHTPLDLNVCFPSGLLLLASCPGTQLANVVTFLAAGKLMYQFNQSDLELMHPSPN